MLIRLIEEKDNQEVEQLIRNCLIEFDANHEGCAWSDPYLGQFYQVYSHPKSQYLVAIENNHVVGGCGIGPIEGFDDICELQKMYCAKEVRGSGLAQQLLDLSLEFAKKHYSKCYLDTFSNMIAANKFYLKNGFTSMDHPLMQGPHYTCDKWYIKDL